MTNLLLKKDITTASRKIAKVQVRDETTEVLSNSRSSDSDGEQYVLKRRPRDITASYAMSGWRYEDSVAK